MGSFPCSYFYFIQRPEVAESYNKNRAEITGLMSEQKPVRCQS